jgi:hypothetical protein
MSDDEQSESDPPRRPVRITKDRILSSARFLERHERIFNVLSTTVTALFTVILATSTVLLWKETKDLRNFAEEQSADMKASIAEAARAAFAMQNVATAVADNATAANASVALFKDANVRQMRAYLTIGFGALIKQDTVTNYHFEARMNLQNVGATPAYKVVSNTHLSVLPFPLPSDFQIPAFAATPSTNVMGPHQSVLITGVADQVYSDDDVKEISFGKDKRLYVYGIVKYEDAFGVSRKITFCQAILWLKNDTFMTLNTPNDNDAD